MSTRRAIALVLAVTVGTAGAASCRDEGGGETELESLVDRIPASALEADDDASPTFSYVDMTIRYEQLDLTDANAERRLEEGSRAFIEPRTFTMLPQLFGDQQVQIDEARSDVGFSAFDIDREAFVSAPPAQTFVVDAPANPDDIGDAVRSAPDWSDDLEEVEADGEPYFSWGDGLRPRPDRITPLHSLGRGGQLAVEEAGDEGSIVTRTLVATDMEAALSVGSDDEPSALDAGPLVPLLDAVGDGEVVQAFATFEPLSISSVLGGRVTPEQLEEMLDEMTLLEPYEAIMVVELVDDDDETTTEVLLAHGDENGAETNVARLADVFADGLSAVTRQPLSETFGEPTIERRGDAVAVTFEGGGDGQFRPAFQAIQQADVFLTN